VGELLVSEACTRCFIGGMPPPRPLSPSLEHIQPVLQFGGMSPVAIKVRKCLGCHFKGISCSFNQLTTNCSYMLIAGEKGTHSFH
jgi:hypothetical protein